MSSRGSLFIFRREILPVLLPKPGGDLDVWAEGFHSFPPDTTITGPGCVGEDGVAEDTLHSVGVGAVVSPGGHTKESVFRVDGTEPTILVESHPGDIVSHALGFPAREGGGYHGKVGLSTAAGEGSGNVALPALRVSESKNLKRRIP